jgi:hypothetical protein
MRRIHSVVIALALTEPLLISKFETRPALEVPDELRRLTDKESFMRMLSHYEIRLQNGVPQRCANQNECDAASGCGA